MLLNGAAAAAVAAAAAAAAAAGERGCGLSAHWTNITNSILLQ